MLSQSSPMSVQDVSSEAFVASFSEAQTTSSDTESFEAVLIDIVYGAWRNWS